MRRGTPHPGCRTRLNEVSRLPPVLLKIERNNKNPLNCTKSGTQYRCDFGNITIPEGWARYGQLEVSEDTKDYFGNELKITQARILSVFIDTTPPEIESINVTTIASTTLFENYTSVGDALQIDFVINEHTTLKGYADISSIVTNDTNELIECQTEPFDYEEYNYNSSNEITGSVVENTTAISGTTNGTVSTASTSNESLESPTKYYCRLETPIIDQFGQVDLDFYFTDKLGNNVSSTYSLEVYGKNLEAVDVWKIENVDCSPEFVDRQVTPLINVKEFCSATLVPLHGDAKTIKMIFGGCISGEQSDTASSSTSGIFASTTTSSNGTVSSSNSSDSIDYLADVSLLNVGPGSTNPFFSLLLKAAEMKIDELDIKCNISIVSEYREQGKRYLTLTPENEEVPIKIKFYNMPLGEFDKAIESKIQEAKDSALASMEFVSQLEKMIKIAEQLCNLIGALVTIENNVNYIWSVISQAANSYPPAKAAVEGPGKVSTNAVEIMSSSYMTYAHKFCQYVSCDRTLWGMGSNFGWGDDGTGRATGGWYSQMTEVLSQKWTPEFVHKMGFDMEVFPSNPKQSIILSMATGCLPGIIHGLQNWRNIQCNYGYCLQTMAAQGVYSDYQVSAKICEDQKAYLECKFIYGEIFQIIPFSAYIKNMLANIAAMLSDPLVLIMGIVPTLCRWIPSLDGTLWCTIPNAIIKLAEIFGQIQLITKTLKDFGTVPEDMCEKLLEGEDS